MTPTLTPRSTDEEHCPHASFRVLHALDRLDRRLVHATRDIRLTPLTDADRTALQFNADTDEAAVEAAVTAHSADPSVGNPAAARDVLRTP